MARYYILAAAAQPDPLSGGFPWPYEIAVCFEQVKYPVVMAEGVAHGSRNHSERIS
jgi:hypothetical protein